MRTDQPNEDSVVQHTDTSCTLLENLCGKPPKLQCKVTVNLPLASRNL